MESLKQRYIGAELLEHANEHEREQNLADLRRINHWTGARRKLRQLLAKRFPAPAPFRFLDIGAASGDLSLHVRDQFPYSRTTVADLDHRNLKRAPCPKVVANAFRLPFADASFDVAHCSLFLHHFPHAECVQLVREMHRVSSKIVLIQDLHRHHLAHRFLPWTQWILRWHKLTVHDGSVSVAAGWTRAELVSVLRDAGVAEQSQIEWHFPSFRYFIAISKL
jgi:ubiquinone/menaquinone biosynthesis C-methylase UbiE